MTHNEIDRESEALTRNSRRAVGKTITRLAVIMKEDRKDVLAALEGMMPFHAAARSPRINQIRTKEDLAARLRARDFQGLMNYAEVLHATPKSDGGDVPAYRAAKRMGVTLPTKASEKKKLTEERRFRTDESTMKIELEALGIVVHQILEDHTGPISDEDLFEILSNRSGQYRLVGISLAIVRRAIESYSRVDLTAHRNLKMDAPEGADPAMLEESDEAMLDGNEVVFHVENRGVSSDNAMLNKSRFAPDYDDELKDSFPNPYES